MKILRMSVAAAALAAAGAFGAAAPAFAWGCVAVSEDGTYGYSYNFNNKGQAIDRALDECATRATTDQTCEITDCEEGS
jgi:hypothetical protein